MGPYELRVGCYPDTVSFTDNPALVTTIDLEVGDPITSIYTIANPTSTRSWCVMTNHELVDNSNAAYGGGLNKFTPAGSQSYT